MYSHREETQNHRWCPSAFVLWSVLLALVRCSAAAGQPVELEKVLITLIEQADVPALQAGQLTAVLVEEGAMVKAGDVLARIDDTDAQLALNRAKIDLANAREAAANTVRIRLARKALELAESELQRGLKSRERFKNSITDEELERRKLAVEKARLDVEQAEHEQKLAQYQLQRSENDVRAAERNIQLRTVAAPIPGIVVQLNRHLGEWVEPGTAVARIVRIDRLRAEAFVDAGLLHRGWIGATVTVGADLPDRGRVQLPGTLRFVSPEVNPVDGKVRVWAEVDNRQLLLQPGMRASMSIMPPKP